MIQEIMMFVTIPYFGLHKTKFIKKYLQKISFEIPHKIVNFTYSFKFNKLNYSSGWNVQSNFDEHPIRPCFVDRAVPIEFENTWSLNKVTVMT